MASTTVLAQSAGYTLRAVSRYMPNGATPPVYAIMDSTVYFDYAGTTTQDIGNSSVSVSEDSAAVYEASVGPLERHREWKIVKQVGNPLRRLTYDMNAYVPGTTTLAQTRHCDYYINANGEYDSVRCVTTDVFQAGSPYLDTRVLYHFNAQNLVDTQNALYYMNTGQVSNSFKIAYEYNAAGKNTAEWFYSSNDGILYTPFFKNEYYYNSNPNPDSTRSYSYINNNWQVTGKSILLYNASNYLVETQGFSYDALTQTYSLSNIVHRMLSASNTLDTAYTASWNASLNQFDTISKFAATYDMANVLLEHVYQYDYNTTTNSWPTMPTNGSNYYYSLVSNVSNTDNPQQDMQLYPNPVSDVLYTACQDPLIVYHIYSLDGRLVQRGSLMQGHRGINVSSLSEGTYMIEITGDKRYGIKPFIKR